MKVQSRLLRRRANVAAYAALPAPGLEVRPLGDGDEAEVLAFLGERVTQSFPLIGFIRSNGLSSPDNRGTFYACRNAHGRLEGVALIGHATLMAVRVEAAVAAFARQAQTCGDLFMLFGEPATAQGFWCHYAARGQQFRRYSRHVLFEQTQACGTEEVAGLRLAVMDDLDLIVPVHAHLAYAESGVDPLASDPKGFRERCAKRIHHNQTWVWREGDRLIFKADVFTDSPEVVYLEGIAVHPEERGKGHGRRCLQQLTRVLLERTHSVILLTNAERRAAQRFYLRAGYAMKGYYDAFFLNPDAC